MNIKHFFACAILLTASYHQVKAKEDFYSDYYQSQSEIVRLRRENASLRNENARLNRENEAMKRQVTRLSESQAGSFVTGAGLGALVGVCLGQENPKKATNTPVTNARETQKAAFDQCNTQRTAGDLALAQRLQAEEDEALAQRLQAEEDENAAIAIAREEARRARR